MRAGFGRLLLAATSFILSGACTVASAAILRESPTAVAPPPRIETRGDPGLSNGVAVDDPLARAPRRSTLSPDSARGRRVPQPPPIDSVSPAADHASSSLHAPLPPVGQGRTLDIGPVPQVVEVQPIPEPSASLLLGAAGFALLARRNRRRSRQ